MLLISALDTEQAAVIFITLTSVKKMAGFLDPAIFTSTCRTIYDIAQDALGQSLLLTTGNTNQAQQTRTEQPSSGRDRHGLDMVSVSLCTTGQVVRIGHAAETGSVTLRNHRGIVQCELAGVRARGVRAGDGGQTGAVVVGRVADAAVLRIEAADHLHATTHVDGGDSVPGHAPAAEVQGLGETGIGDHGNRARREVQAGVAEEAPARVDPAED